MFREKYVEFICECKELLEESKDKKIQNSLKTIKEHYGDRYDDKIKTIIHLFITEGFEETTNPQEELEALRYILSDVAKSCLQSFRNYIMEISVQGYESEVNRTMIVPATMSLEDLGWAVMISLHGMMDHYFVMEHGGELFYTATMPEKPGVGFQADHVLLHLMDLRKRSKIKMTYDFGENWEINIRVKDIKKLSYLPDITELEILDGKGFGIWEDAKQFFELYYDEGEEALKECMDDYGIDEDAFPYDIPFDKDAMNQILLECLTTDEEMDDHDYLN